MISGLKQFLDKKEKTCKNETVENYKIILITCASVYIHNYNYCNTNDTKILKKLARIQAKTDWCTNLI